MKNTWVVGVDLGGTKVEIGLIDPENRIREKRKMPTEAAEGPAYVVEKIALQVAEMENLLPAGERVAALGICCPGPLDHEAGILINPTNLPRFYNTPLKQMLEDRLHIPVRMEHDAKATGLGEYYYGAGRGERSMVFTIIGTGVGAAIIVNGEIYRGMKNFAGEIGHATLDRNGEPCPCGSRGCLETYTSGPWLARKYAHALALEPRADLNLTPEQITGEVVYRQAQAGDPAALRIITEAGEAVGIAVATMAMILDIELYVFGGSVARCGEMLLEPARRTVLQYSFKTVGPRVRLAITELGDDGPILGCGWLARQALT